MFPILVECGQILENGLDKFVQSREGVDIKDLSQNLTTDIIGIYIKIS